MTRRNIVLAVLFGAAFSIQAEEPSTKISVYTPAQAAAGRKAYLSVCFNCHQANLVGRKGEPGELPPVASLPPGMQKDIMNAGGIIPQLAGGEFMARWAERTTADLSKRIKGASPFLKQADPLLAEDTDENAYLNLTAYILQANGAQPGTHELTKDTAVELRTIATGVAPQATTEALPK